MKLTLDSPVSDVQMVGPAYQRRLKKLEINTVGDLLLHAPHRYEDFSQTSEIATTQPGETVTVKASIIDSKNIFTRSGKQLQKLLVQDKSGQLTATWFNQPYIVNTCKVGQQIYLSGKIAGSPLNRELMAPAYEIVKREDQTPIHTNRMVPIYPETEGLSSKWLRSRIAPLIKDITPTIEDWLPREIRLQEDLPSLSESIQNIHFPNSTAGAHQAKARLAFDEMFLLQLSQLKKKKEWSTTKSAHQIESSQLHIQDLINQLPFKLTSAQTRVTQEILSDLSLSHPMNRLLQGDVGAGKTIIAAIAMFTVWKNGGKSAFMAPTEILVQQHLDSLQKVFAPYKIKIAILTGKKKNIPKDFDMVIGTHALLFSSLQKQDLSLIIIDEQHRFGVEQRSKLIQKSGAPHLLTMTATPIPRSVALTLYGNLDLSILDELPKGRRQVKTWVVPPKKRIAAYDWIRQKLETGEQAFIVCPLIEESDHETMTQVKAATQEIKDLQSGPLKHLSLGLLHGKMKSQDKEDVLNDFRMKKLDALITTPVVEVGIDIPNATIMTIEGAERFGLAQLHQFRGRVGRSNLQSYCLLFTSSGVEVNLRRLRAIETMHVGIQLAEFDLKLRGPGEMYGTRQHGFSHLKFASLQDVQLISRTKLYASKIIKNDPKLTHHPKLMKQVMKLENHSRPN